MPPPMTIADTVVPNTAYIIIEPIFEKKFPWKYFKKNAIDYCLFQSCIQYLSADLFMAIFYMVATILNHNIS